jgi:hypothetical protein
LKGTQSRRLLQPFKRGSFVLAQDAGVPVVPVSLGVKASRSRMKAAASSDPRPGSPDRRTPQDVAAEVPPSSAISASIRSRGWRSLMTALL